MNEHNQNPEQCISTRVENWEEKGVTPEAVELIKIFRSPNDSVSRAWFEHVLTENGFSETDIDTTDPSDIMKELERRLDLYGQL